GEKTILSAFEKSMTKVVSKKLEKNGAEVITEAFAKSVEESDEGVKVTYEVDGEEKTIEADYVLVTVGRSPNTKEIGLEEAGIEFDETCRFTIAEYGRTRNDKRLQMVQNLDGDGEAQIASDHENAGEDERRSQHAVIAE